jgi:hypothetical protein
VLSPSYEETFSIEPVLKHLQLFAETVEYNMFHKHEGGGPQLIQIIASRLSIDHAPFYDFARFAARNGQVFLDSADDRLKSYAATPNHVGAEYWVGVFVFFLTSLRAADRINKRGPYSLMQP